MGGKLIIAAGLVIFRYTPVIQYLLLQHSKGIHHWTPPKGHVNRGETDLMVTALRETREETNLVLKDLEFYNFEKVLHYKVKKNKPKEVHFFLAKLTNPNAEVKLSHEHTDFKWLPFSEACEIGKFKNFKIVLEEIHQYIENNFTVLDIKSSYPTI